MPARGPVPVKSAAARDLPHEILSLLDDKGGFSTDGAFPEVPRKEIKSALDRLASRSMVEYDAMDTEVALLTKEAEDICDKGSHEYRVWDLVRQRGRVPIKQLTVGQPASLRLALTGHRRRWAPTRPRSGRAPPFATRGSRRTATRWCWSRRDARAAPEDPRHKVRAGRQGARGPAQAQAGHDGQGHQLPGAQGPGV
jgi:hypothetical protein